MIGRNTRSSIKINRNIWKIKVCVLINVLINSRKTFIMIYKLTHCTTYVLCMEPYIQPKKGILGNSEASFISAQNAQYLSK